MKEKYASQNAFAVKCQWVSVYYAVQMKIEVEECKVIEVEQDPVKSSCNLTHSHQNLVNKLVNNHPSKQTINSTTSNQRHCSQSINKCFINVHKKMKEK